MKTIYFSTYTYTPEEVLKAFCHVKEHFPLTHAVRYDAEGEWEYLDQNGLCICLNDKESVIDKVLLEKASDRAYICGYPVCFSLYPEKVLAECNVPNKPKVVLTQIEPELFDVTVGPGASTTWNTLDQALYEFTESINSYVKED